jgi:hypothetical protein
MRMRSGQGADVKEVSGEGGVCLAVRDGGPGVVVAGGVGGMPWVVRIFETVEGVTLISKMAGSPWIFSATSLAVVPALYRSTIV